MAEVNIGDAWNELEYSFATLAAHAVLSNDDDLRYLVLEVSRDLLRVKEVLLDIARLSQQPNT